jgi:hypothetical protein
VSKNSEEITKEVKDFLDHFVQNLTKESMNQLNLLKSDISSLKNEEGSWKFPSDGAIEAYTPEVYELFYDRVCNAASAALVSYLKEMSLISREIEPFSLRENNLDIVKDKIRQPFSVGRFLINASDTSSSHEFVIINVQSKIYLVQADIYRQLRVDQVGGVCELSDKDLENLFSNDQETFEKLFKLHPKKKANLKIQAFDWYPMSGLNLQKEEGLVELNKLETKVPEVSDNSDWEKKLEQHENFYKKELQRILMENDIKVTLKSDSATNIQSAIDALFDLQQKLIDEVESFKWNATVVSQKATVTEAKADFSHFEAFKQKMTDEIKIITAQLTQQLNQIKADAQTNLQQINQKTSELLSYLSKTPTPTTIAVVARLQQEVQQLDTLQQDTKRILGKLPKNSLPNALKILQEAEVAINLATKELNTSASAKKTVAPDGSQEIRPQQKKQLIVFSMFKDLHSQLVSDNSPLTAINISQELNISTDQLKQGIELTVPTTQHKFTFKHDEGNIAQAILTRQQAGLKDNEPIAVKDDKLRKDICIDVINMIENVLSQGENLNLKISDPYLAAFGRYYVEYLKLLKEPKLNISSNEENLSAGTAQQREEFKQIVTMYHQHHSLANMKWVHEHITKTTSPLLSLSTGPCIS